MVQTLHPPLPVWKRFLDLTCCVLAFPFFALLTCAVSALMRFASPGPVFFRQERIGLNGRRFKLYKFRTMHVNADTRGHQQHLAQLIQSNTPMQKLDSRGDSRLIPLGWILRCTGLDELPQIVNVWKGEMSIVGPRPCIPYEYEQYPDDAKARFASVPGLTGLWQVSGKNRTTFDEMVRFDVEYASRKSFWLDCKIIVLTPFALAIQVMDTKRARQQNASVTQMPFPSHASSEANRPVTVSS